jgi:hypothetical protein
MTVEVKQEHINRGMEGVCFKCPIALAILETMVIKYGYRGTVSIDPVFITLYNPLKTIPTPPAVFDFMQDFDNYVPVEPFTLELEIA